MDSLISRIFIILALTPALIPELIWAQGERGAAAAQQLYTSEERDRLFQQAVSALPPARIPSELRSMSRADPGARCGTMILAEARLNFDVFTPTQKDVLRKALVRPSLPFSWPSDSGQFLIHYDTSGIDAVSPEDLNTNSVPDYVEAIAEMFDFSHDLEVNDMEYRAPPNDNGVDGPQYDVYIEGLGSGFYGFTTPEFAVAGTQNNDFTSYIQVDNDFMNGQFTRGLDGARVTAAHEYFHALQFGYRSASVTNEFFYFELCSTWMEDVAYDEVNDYYAVVPHFLSRPHVPFHQFDRFSLYNYGSSIWNHFLVAKLGDASVIKRSWEIMQDGTTVLNAIQQALFEKGRNFQNEFADFAIWNYFTGSRADTVNYYEESNAYQGFSFEGEFSITGDTTIVDSSLSLTSSYYRFTAFESSGYAISGNVSNAANWKFAAIVTPPAGEVSTHIFDITRSQNLGAVPQFSEIIVIPVNLQIVDGPDLPMLRSTFSSFRFNLLQVPVGEEDESGITEIYPNPFVLGRQGQMNFEFEAANTVDLEVRILTAGGAVVKAVKFAEGTSFLRPDSFTWDGTNRQNEPVASGIYVFQLKQAGFVASEKFAVIRE